VVLALGTALLTVACRGGKPVCGGATAVDRALPVVAGPDVVDGHDRHVETGKTTVINVWGSWCGPCRVEQPILNRARERHPEIGFLGLDVQDNDAAARAFRKEFGVDYPSISDPSREVASRLGARSTPATFVVSPDGRVKAHVQGTLGADMLECMIASAQGGRTPVGRMTRTGSR